MDEKKMKTIIENCSYNDLQRLTEMVKEEKEKRDDVSKAEIETIFTKIRELIHTIEDRGCTVTYLDNEIDAGDLSWEWYEK